MTSPVAIRPGVCDTCDSGQSLFRKTAINNFGDRRASTFRVGVSIKELAPHRSKKNQVVREAQVLLRYLKLGHQLCPGHRAKQRMKRLAWLEIDRSILH